jgi:hypothetical protein
VRTAASLVSLQSKGQSKGSRRKERARAAPGCGQDGEGVRETLEFPKANIEARPRETRHDVCWLTPSENGRGCFYPMDGADFGETLEQSRAALARQPLSSSAEKLSGKKRKRDAE